MWLRLHYITGRCEKRNKTKLTQCKFRFEIDKIDKIATLLSLESHIVLHRWDLVSFTGSRADRNSEWYTEYMSPGRPVYTANSSTVHRLHHELHLGRLGLVFSQGGPDPLRTAPGTSHVKALESIIVWRAYIQTYRHTDGQTYRHDQNYTPRRFAGGQK